MHAKNTLHNLIIQIHADNFSLQFIKDFQFVRLHLLTSFVRIFF